MPEALKAGARIALLVAALIAAGYGLDHWLGYEFNRPGPTAQPLRVQVQPGSSVRTVLAELSERGAIRSARNTALYLRLHQGRVNIKAGEYEIPAHASAAAVIAQLEQGRVVMDHVTIVEGTTFAELRHTLEQQPDIRHTLRGKSDAQVMAAIGHPGQQPEGRFFPDTYEFAAGTTDVTLLELAYRKMQRELQQAWAQRSPHLPIHTAYQALILASIVEKETGLESERARIAGVFTERLRKGMRLQSDPTVIYGLGAKYDGDIHVSDLTTDTPYNTYTRAGLPPTPISLPGRASLLAAVRPEVTGDLYFVATGNGGHHFSATLADHKAAIRRYLALLKQRSQQQAKSEEAKQQAAGTLPVHESRAGHDSAGMHGTKPGTRAARGG